VEPPFDITSLIGHQFPGGIRTIERWENFLLTDCTGREQLADGLVHPIALFHVPLQGSGTSIAELFELGGATGAGSVGLEGYDWQYFRPLREGVPYDTQGGIVSVESRTTQTGRRFDRVAFRIELSEPGGEPAARVTNTWRFYREDT
jgi:hypothetical protein